MGADGCRWVMTGAGLMLTELVDVLRASCPVWAALLSGSLVLAAAAEAAAAAAAGRRAAHLSVGAAHAADGRPELRARSLRRRVGEPSPLVGAALPPAAPATPSWGCSTSPSRSYRPGGLAAGAAWSALRRSQRAPPPPPLPLGLGRRGAVALRPATDVTSCYQAASSTFCRLGRHPGGAASGQRLLARTPLTRARTLYTCAILPRSCTCAILCYSARLVHGRQRHTAMQYRRGRRVTCHARRSAGPHRSCTSGDHRSELRDRRSLAL